MDFWDIFIKEEEVANLTALQILGEYLPELNDKYSIVVYTDFVDLDEIGGDEFITTLALLDNLDKINKPLSPAAIVLLYKFYNMIEDSYEVAATRLLKLFDFKSIRIKADKTLIDDFNNAVETYSNFNDTEYLEELNFDNPSGKMMIVYNGQIIIIYLKEGTEDYGI